MSSSISSSRRFVLVFLGVFAVGSAIFVAGGEYLIRKAFLPRDGFGTYKRAFWSTQAPTAVFGDSHAASAIETGPTVENLGYGGESLPNMLEKVHAFVNRAPGTRRIVIQFGPHQVSTYRVESDQSEQLSELFDTEGYLLESMRPRFRRYLTGYWRAVLRNPSLLTEPGTPPAEVVPARGKGLVEWPRAEQQRIAELRVQLQAPLPSGPVVDRILGRLFATVKSLGERGVQVCLVQFPLSEAYRRATAAVPAYAVIQKRAMDAAAEMGVPFVDLTAAMPDAMFADPDHIALWGRKDVTALVLDRCFAQRVSGGAPDAKDTPAR